MSNKIICIGEMLIDFTADSIGDLKNIESFTKNPGGAPANVAVCVAKLGGKSAMITQLGKDAFGEFLVETLNENKVDTSQIKFTGRANTALAFVSLDEKGDRDFLFYRKPSSDLFLDSVDINESFFDYGDILHFCSVDLVDYPVRNAHLRAIDIATKKGMIVSFDTNLRYSLWESSDELLSTVKAFVPYAHIVKVSEEELLALTNIKNEAQAVRALMTGNVKIVFVTKGEGGSSAYFERGENYFQPSVKTTCVDATGAGDVFIGTILFLIQNCGINLENLEDKKNQFSKFLTFANKAAALSIMKKGAIPSMPTYEEVFR